MKQDTFSKRFRLLKQLGKQLGSSPTVDFFFPAKVGALSAASSPPDSNTWVAYAQSALRANSISSDPHLQRAFTELKLNPEDPRQWRELASQMAYVLFPHVDRGGRPAEWNSKRYCELLKEVHDAKKRQDISGDEEACAFVAKKSNRAYFNKAGRDGLKKALQKARSPKHNGTIRDLLRTIEPRMKRRYEEAGAPWTPEIEERLAALLAARIGAL
ncbi:hypothetical protein [Bradyrhizobium sp. 2S1]|uniref:hypothetical protein n=1 Tax=Bradyrhizobium sp. 2S1 TaxID=1404429 RepID=UPI00140E2FF5|nr:hypothetical protein [Bradyrhizobium sp. 2S1]MCK7667941.1 hypothetical protein [Bradyrhizobium sp. 2S1]